MWGGNLSLKSVCTESREWLGSIPGLGTPFSPKQLKTSYLFEQHSNLHLKQSQKSYWYIIFIFCLEQVSFNNNIKS